MLVEDAKVAYNRSLEQVLEVIDVARNSLEYSLWIEEIAPSFTALIEGWDNFGCQTAIVIAAHQWVGRAHREHALAVLFVELANDLNRLTAALQGDRSFGSPDDVQRSIRANVAAAMTFLCSMRTEEFVDRSSDSNGLSLYFYWASGTDKIKEELTLARKWARIVWRNRGSGYASATADASVAMIRAQLRRCEEAS